MIKKPDWIKDIKVLVWDLDGTLYQEITEIKKGIRKNVIQAISRTKNISLKTAEKLFGKVYKKLNSSSQAMLYCQVDKDFVFSGRWYSKVQLKYLKKDVRLPGVFKKLKSYRHIIGSNGEAVSVAKKLKILGLRLDIFEKIFTNADMFGKLKPDLVPFKEVLKYTKLEPKKHLFLGDREETDLLPAKKVGMKTCLIWGKSKVADISLPKVYDVVKLFQ